MNLVEQVVNFGRVFYLIELRKDLLDDLLIFLKDKTSDNIRYLVAWRELCKIDHVYFKDGSHFLTANTDRYFRIMRFLCHVPDFVNKNDTTKLLPNIYPPMTAAETKYVARIMSASSRNREKFDIESLKAIGSIHSLNTEGKISADLYEHVKHIKFPYIYKIFIDRINFIKLNAPDYFEMIKPTLTSFFERTINTGKNFDVYNSTIIKLLGLGINVDHVEFKLLGTTPEQKLYLLGFQIMDGVVFSEEEMKNRLKLTEKELTELVISSNKKWISEWIDVFVGTTVDVIYNTESVAMESIYSYLPFDIIPFYDGLKVYVFLRHDIEHILKSGRNIYTNATLPKFFIASLYSKFVISESLNLPECRCLPYCFETESPHRENNGFGTDDDHRIDDEDGLVDEVVVDLFENFFRSLGIEGNIISPGGGHRLFLEGGRFSH